MAASIFVGGFFGRFMEIEYVDVNKLVPYARNPRRITKAQFEKLCKNVKNDSEFLALRPLLINDCEKGLVVYAGNQRLKAAMHLNMKTVPCIIQKDLPEDVLKKRMVLDNINYGEFDYDLLSCEFEIDELLELGIAERELDVYDIDELEEDLKPKKKKMKACPSCGHEF